MMAFLSRWRTMGRLVSVLLLALSFSCFGGGGGSNPPPEGSLQVFNGGNSTMLRLFVTPSTSSTWGVDQLAPSALLPGDSITLTRLLPDSYDVLADFSDGSSDQVFDVLIQDGINTTLSMVNTGNGAVDVFNNSGLTINGVYLTPANASTFGPNQTDQPLFSGQTLRLTGISPGIYDLRVIFFNGQFQDTTGRSVNSGTVTTIQVN